jgi:hypothetical protein
MGNHRVNFFPPFFGGKSFVFFFWLGCLGRQDVYLLNSNGALVFGSRNLRWRYLLSFKSHSFFCTRVFFCTCFFFFPCWMHKEANPLIALGS